ncbi:hypothetical protein [Burkholderia sp. Ac-20392]|uniref:hypothetical protein n=1 Tax=Burkholderia sp. Ac-20392 TaxID=2703905 RepID=UPI00197EDD44|nr:hypothetical protein [Burkholderia sp. Ac-20392]MBN3795451.1 hypothetical protein [Burkholderia sp. Ac-20392]
MKLRAKTPAYRERCRLVEAALRQRRRVLERVANDRRMKCATKQRIPVIDIANGTFLIRSGNEKNVRCAPSRAARTPFRRIDRMQCIFWMTDRTVNDGLYRDIRDDLRRIGNDAAKHALPVATMCTLKPKVCTQRRFGFDART